MNEVERMPTTSQKSENNLKLKSKSKSNSSSSKKDTPSPLLAKVLRFKKVEKKSSPNNDKPQCKKCHKVLTQKNINSPHSQKGYCAECSIEKKKTLTQRSKNNHNIHEQFGC